MCTAAAILSFQEFLLYTWIIFNLQAYGRDFSEEEYGNWKIAHRQLAFLE
jgi:hypothetical protein